MTILEYQVKINKIMKDKHIKKFNEHQEIPNENSLEKLVESILDDCKLDVNDIKESDPEFIGHLSEQILKWHNDNSNNNINNNIDTEEYGRKCFYDGREIARYDDKGRAIFKHPTYNGYMRLLDKKTK